MKTDEQILKSAEKAAEYSYSPYSKFKVGACALFESGHEYSGCNVENSSYGLSLCAERNALSNAIAAGEKSRLLKLAIYSPMSFLCFPCGACLQWIYEFSQKRDIQIVLQDKDNSCKSFFLKDLLPFPFELE